MLTFDISKRCSFFIREFFVIIGLVIPNSKIEFGWGLPTQKNVHTFEGEG